MELTLESIEGRPHTLFFDGVRSEKTRKNYVLFLQKFLDVVPVSIYRDILNEEPENEFNKQIDQFCKLAKTDVKITKQIIHAFVRELKDKVEKKEIKPGTISNYLKPIKALFAVNEIDFSWKLINKSLPLVGKTSDRAYTREELQTLLANSHDIVDDVIVLLFSSAGFRVEAWDYFTWSDVKFFYTKDVCV
jgi:integrase